ncbi:LCP family protein [Streptomyces sp. TP-A0874]|uniref:LCP family protein n=1 Tax=Streptomyces sp. TP-A0874 TaxID=549819 RepID=UPI00099F4C8A|nr:LCP family protein [Streptomyces sp. TP-A0874]
MSDWPQGWTEDSRDGYGRGSAAPRPESARAMRHVQRGGDPRYGGRPTGEPPLPPEFSPHGRIPSQQSQGYEDIDGYGPGQVYGGGGQGPYGPSRPNWGRRFKVTVLSLVVVLLAVSLGTYFWADSKLDRQVDLSLVENRPAEGKGTNYLIVGSDSRKGLSAEEKQRLHTGSSEGQLTDSMIILHVGSNGSTMVSLPRDTWVTVPEFTGTESGRRIPEQQAKLNSVHVKEGGWLLTRTVEYNTGLKIDHYVEIGLGGFAKIVDAIGGVEMDIPRDIKDRDSGADFKKGRQTLDGAQALAFVRNRKEAGSDLERTKNQQKFLAALASQTATPSTVLNPFKLYPAMGAGLDTLTVDKDMSLWNLASMFWAMKGVSGGEGEQINLPTGGPAPLGSLQLDKPKIKQLVDQLNNDEKVTVSSP